MKQLIDGGTFIRLVDPTTGNADMRKSNIRSVIKDPDTVTYPNNLKITYIDSAGAQQRITLDPADFSVPVFATRDDMYQWFITSSRNNAPVQVSGEPTLIDEVSSDFFYLGYSLPLTPSSVAGWMIKRVKKTGSTYEIAYATSYMDSSNIWDNRASLTYVI